MAIFQNVTSAVTTTPTRALLLTLGAGTISATISTSIVTGSGTSFLAFLRSGDILFMNGQENIIQSVDSNTQLTMRDVWVAAITASSTLSYYPREVQGGNRIVTVKASSNNSGSVFVGESLTNLGTGSDIGVTTRTLELLLGQESSPIVVNNLRDLWVVPSTTSTQRFSVNIQQ